MTVATPGTATDDQGTTRADGTPTQGLRVAGLAGVAFAASVAVQNLWSGGSGILPDADATGADVLAVFADHRGAYGILVGWVAINLVALAVFLAGAHQRLRRNEPLAADVGLVGGVMLMVFFAMVNLPVVVLASMTESLAGSPELVEALWTIHGAVFAFAGIALGIALVGFSLAASSAGLAPRWFRVVGPAGAAVIIAASVPVQAGAAGSPATMVGLLASSLRRLVAVPVRVRRPDVAPGLMPPSAAGTATPAAAPLDDEHQRTSRTARPPRTPAVRRIRIGALARLASGVVLSGRSSDHPAIIGLGSAAAEYRDTDA